MPMTERSCSCASCSCRLKKKDQGRANPPKKVNTHKVLKKIFIFMFWYSFLSIAAQKLHINMVVRCCVKNCKRNNKDDKEHSFFSFPSDPKITKKWLEFYGTKNVCGYQRICSDHFEEKCFKKIYPRRLLWNDAIPTINTANLSSSENRLEEDVISNYDIEQEQPSNETTEANHRVEKPIDILMTSDMIQITSKNPRRLLRNDAIPTINTRNLSSSENRLEEDVISNNYDIEQEQPSNEIAEANHRVETPIDILMTSDMIQITSKKIDRIIIFTKDGKEHRYWFNK